MQTESTDHIYSLTGTEHATFKLLHEVEVRCNLEVWILPFQPQQPVLVCKRPPNLPESVVWWSCVRGFQVICCFEYLKWSVQKKLDIYWTLFKKSKEMPKLLTGLAHQRLSPFSCSHYAAASHVSQTATQDIPGIHASLCKETSR